MEKHANNTLYFTFQLTHESGIGRLPLDTETVNFQDWKITYSKSHILKSVCPNKEQCKLGDEGCCELCL